MGRKWTQEEIEYLEKNRRKKDLGAIAKKLKRSVSSVENKCHRLKVYKERWTEAELQYLRENAGEKTAKQIAKELKRGQYAVEQRINKLGMSYTVDHGKISLYLLVNTLGYVSESKAYERLEKLGLKIHKIQKRNMKVKMVDIDEFWKWAEEHQDELNFSRLEHNALGSEPEWAKKKIDRETKARIKYKANKRWTKEEEKMLMEYARIGLNNLEISKRLQRTGASIIRKLDKLNTYYRPVPQDNKTWTEEEEQHLLKLVAEGTSWDDMVDIFSRSANAIRSKYNRMKAKEQEEEECQI